MILYGIIQGYVYIILYEAIMICYIMILLNDETGTANRPTHRPIRKAVTKPLQRPIHRLIDRPIDKLINNPPINKHIHRPFVYVRFKYGRTPKFSIQHRSISSKNICLFR